MSTSKFDDLVVIGGGNMGAALIGGWLGAGANPKSITVVELSSDRRQYLTSAFAEVHVTDAIPNCESVLVAVKPNDVLTTVTNAVSKGATRVVSIAAGVSTAMLQKAAGENIAVVRTMPNTPALVGKGLTAVCTTASSNTAVVAWAESLFTSVGEVIRIPESAVDVYTGLIGSGPAYLFHLAEALIAAGNELGAAAGLEPQVVEMAVQQLFLGSAALLASGRGTASELRQNVTSPNGTTAAGLEVLFSANLLKILENTVSAAAVRSAEMTRELDSK